MAQDTFVTYTQLRDLGIPYCRLEINRLMARKAFQEAVWLGANRKVWRLRDIERYLATRPTERPAVTEPADAA